MSGWIKLHRSILEWEWYSDKNTKCLFIHLLLTANIENKKWRGIEILRGQIFTSIHSLSKELKLTAKQTRNCLTKLKSSGEIGIQGANNGTMITICNYESYQYCIKQNGEQTVKQRANKGQQLKNDKEIKKDMPEWKNDFLAYQEICRIAFDEICKDSKWLNQQSSYYINIDIKKSIEKCFVNYWSTEQGWENKKKSGYDSINWKTTLGKSLSFESNQVKKEVRI